MHLRVETVAHVNLSDDPDTFGQICALGLGCITGGDLVLRVDHGLQRLTTCDSLSAKILYNLLDTAAQRGAWQLRIHA
jgi:hypothetical protein